MSAGVDRPDLDLVLTVRKRVTDWLVGANRDLEFAALAGCPGNAVLVGLWLHLCFRFLPFPTVNHKAQLCASFAGA